MASSHGRLARFIAGQTLAKPSQCLRTNGRLVRCYSTTFQSNARTQVLGKKTQRLAHIATSKHVRYAANDSATAPAARAYIESGAISGAQDLVDVKKVLVIGSGGLSIGQAGEFDYSGT